MYRIAIIEDDEKIAGLLQAKLEQYSYSVHIVTQFKDILEELEEFQPQLVLLDINLPYYDGYYWCRQIRKSSSIPIIFISAREGEMDQVMAIENGGDDFITKPLQLELFVAKVRGHLRRAYGEYAASTSESDDLHTRTQQATEGKELSREDQASLEQHGLLLLMNRNELHYMQKQIDLTRNELLLMESLLRHHGQVVSRDILLEALWDDVQFVDDNTLTVNMTRVRKKLAELGLPNAIETIRGQGYKLKLEESV